MIVLGLFFLFSCDTKESVKPSLTSSEINLGNLHPGQVSRYQRFTFDREGEVFGQRTFFNDTLHVEVMAEENGGFIVTEYITSQSDILQDPNEYWPTEVWTNAWFIHDDSLSIASTEPNTYIDVSHLLFFRAEPFPISAYRDHMISDESWFPSSPYTQGLIEGTIKAPKLNVRIDNTGLILDGPNMIYYFEPNGRIIRTISVTLWGGSGYGWELISD